MSGVRVNICLHLEHTSSGKSRGGYTICQKLNGERVVTVADATENNVMLFAICIRFVGLNSASCLFSASSSEQLRVVVIR